MMTEKIILSVCVLGIDKFCEFSVPKTMAVKDAIQLIVRIVGEEYGVDNVGQDKQLSLLRMVDAKALNNSLSVFQNGITNGEKLILV